MKRLLGSAIAACTAFSISAMAATPERVRGTVTAVTADSVTVQTAGKDVTVGLTPATHYLKVVKSSLTNVDKDSYIGTATKQVGGKLIALEVVIFPPAMKGTGDGHYGWDRIPDTTVSGGSGTTSSSMTNGTVSAVQSNDAMANTSMTNGMVSSSHGKAGAKQITVTYKGGDQTVLVPPTAPIVAFEPNTMSDLVKGKTVFVLASDTAGKLTANAVAIGADGVTPPM